MSRSIIICVLLLSACGDETTPDAGPLAIAGTWADDFGQDHAVTGASWTITGFGLTSLFNIVEYDNDGRTIIAHNAADNDYNPDLWSRFDWTFHEEELWYCQSVVDGATEADARAAAAAGDDHSPATTGCGGYAWSRLRVPLAIRGNFEDDQNIVHAITQATWTQTDVTYTSTFHIAAFDNDSGTLTAQNDTANTTFADRWSRFDWVTNGDGLWYCHTENDGATEEAAAASAAPDASAPGTGGCGGLSWSRLDEVP